MWCVRVHTHVCACISMALTHFLSLRVSTANTAHQQSGQLFSQKASFRGLLFKQYLGLSSSTWQMVISFWITLVMERSLSIFPSEVTYTGPPTLISQKCPNYKEPYLRANGLSLCLCKQASSAHLFLAVVSVYIFMHVSQHLRNTNLKKLCRPRPCLLDEKHALYIFWESATG